MSRRPNNPETPVPEEIHRVLERPKSHPGTDQFFTVLGAVLRVEESSVPLGLWVEEVSRGAEGCGPGTEVGCCGGEVVADRATVVPVGVAGRIN